MKQNNPGLLYLVVLKRTVKTKKCNERRVRETDAKKCEEKQKLGEIFCKSIRLITCPDDVTSLFTTSTHALSFGGGREFKEVEELGGEVMIDCWTC